MTPALLARLSAAADDAPAGSVLRVTVAEWWEIAGYVRELEARGEPECAADAAEMGG